jgi:hypothetical protein
MAAISISISGRDMINRSRKILNIFFLIVFLLLSSVICLFHTESPFGYDPLCPACRFQNSAIAVAQFDFFQLPILTILETIELEREIPCEFITLPLFDARSPPPA